MFKVCFECCGRIFCIWLWVVWDVFLEYMFWFVVLCLGGGSFCVVCCIWFEVYCVLLCFWFFGFFFLVFLILFFSLDINFLMVIIFFFILRVCFFICCWRFLDWEVGSVVGCELRVLFMGILCIEEFMMKCGEWSDEVDWIFRE